VCFQHTERMPLVGEWNCQVMHTGTARIFPATNGSVQGYSKLLPDVVTIADEVDAQLKQQMLHYMEANAIGTKPHTQPVK
jgi:hypothetical protein